MATAVHHEEHGLPLSTRVSRARMGVLLLILSDAIFISAMYASQAYLRILHSDKVFRGGESAPSVGIGLILAAVVVLSAVAYFWGEWRHRTTGGLGEYRLGLLIALALTLVAFVAQIFVVFSLRYPVPTLAYGSLVMIMSTYHMIHLFLTALIGFLLLGRLTNNRIVGHEYVTEVSGYWWYYIALTAVTTWALISFVK